MDKSIPQLPSAFAFARGPDALTRLADQLESEENERHRHYLAFLRQVRAMARQGKKQLAAVSAGTRGRRPRFQKMSPMRLVYEAAATFRDAPFTADDLCDRVARDYPEFPYSRSELAKRFYDLRQLRPPVIEEVEPPSDPRLSTMPPEKKYKFVGDPPETPAAE